VRKQRAATQSELVRAQLMKGAASVAEEQSLPKEAHLDVVGNGDRKLPDAPGCLDEHRDHDDGARAQSSLKLKEELRRPYSFSRPRISCLTLDSSLLKCSPLYTVQGWPGLALPSRSRMNGSHTPQACL